MNIREALRIYSAELAEISEEASLETRLIIQKAAGLSRPVLFSHPERMLSADETESIRAMTDQRKKGIPLPYILGEWEFYGHSFTVDPSVLIPRPETELLVETASSWLKAHPDCRSGFDIGTGSGCIAVSLLLDFPDLRMTGVDRYRNALMTACRNAGRHHCRDRFDPVQADLFTPFADHARLICANLPYIPSDTCRTIEPARFEPVTALDGGPDGFSLYRLLFKQIKNKINKTALVLCELEYRQRETALYEAEKHFSGANIRVAEDLAGLPRLLIIEIG